MCIYKRITSKNGIDINANIISGFLAHHQRDDINKTHLFDGRYENIYLTSQHIPELTSLMAEAVEHAEKILQLKNLRAGFWFNFMPQGSTTSMHTHDDDDELLSAVYYVDTSENSGNLIIYDDSTKTTKKIEVTPEAGDFIFFKPDIRHEVSRNNSSKPRLSIGINFGQPGS